MKLCILICSLLLSVEYGKAQDCAYILSGHVEDKDSKATLKEAVVQLLPNQVTVITDEHGDFQFKNLCAGSYTLIVSHVSCETVEMKIDVKSNRHVDVFLPHEHNTLETVFLSSTKETLKGYHKELSEQELAETKGLSIGQTLAKINGVQLLQTGSTIAKPIIHGLHGNRILSINNGVRQEGQQWGNEHALEIDPHMASKISVVKGVEGLRYGSDAIAAVVLIDPAAILPQPGYKVEINSSYFTNNQQQVLSLGFENRSQQLPQLGYRLQASVKRSANVTTPHYRLNNTATRELNYAFTAAWKEDNFETELYLSRYAAKLGIFSGSHLGNISDLQAAIDADRPDDVFIDDQSYAIQRPSQEAIHHILKSNSLFKKSGHRFQVKLSVQNNRRKEFDILRNDRSELPQMDLSVFTFSEDFVWEQPTRNGFSGTAGLAFQQQDNRYGGRYFIPNYRSYSYGGFYMHTYRSRIWEAEAGVRFDYKNLQTTRLTHDAEKIQHAFNFNSIAAAINGSWKPTQAWKNSLTFSLATRAPQVNELLSDGIHHGTATYEVGNLALQSEKSVHINLGIQYQNPAETFRFDVNLYNNYVHDFVYKKPVPSEPVLTIAGAFPKIVYDQTDALLQGLDVSAQLQIIKNLQWQPRFAMLRARDKKADDWMLLMPADRLENRLQYNFGDSHFFHDAYIAFTQQYVFEQTRVPTKNGSSDFKAPPAAYNLYSSYLSSVLHFKNMPLQISVGVNNLFNTVYRDYLNGFRYFSDEMGRNVFIQLNIPFSKKYNS